MTNIKGFRSAISHVLKVHGTDLSLDENLGGLFRSLEIQRPVIQSLTLKWDLALVLRHLLEVSYEPIFNASLKAFSLKTAFSLSRASAKRFSEVHAFSPTVYHSHDWFEVQIEFDISFYLRRGVLVTLRLTSVLFL